MKPWRVSYNICEDQELIWVVIYGVLPSVLNLDCRRFLFSSSAKKISDTVGNSGHFRRNDFGTIRFKRCQYGGSHEFSCSNRACFSHVHRGNGH